MSREMVLVPLAQWKRLKEQVTNQASATTDSGLSKNQADYAPASGGSENAYSNITTIPEEATNESSKSESEIIELLPKAYCTRAKVIMHYLAPSLKLDQSNRVLFPDGTVGAHVLDYLRYFLNSLKTKAPLYAEKFDNIMEKSGVPRSVYRHVSSVKWLTF